MIPTAIGKIGLDFETVDVRCFLRGDPTAATSTVSAGDLVAFCIADVAEITGDTFDTGLTSATYVPGARNSMFANVTKNYTSTNVGVQLFGIALESGTCATSANVNSKISVRVRGIVKAAVQSADGTTSVSIGSDLMPSTPGGTGNKAGFLDASVSASPTSTATRRKIGIALQATSATSVGSVMYVLFDGLNGFGSANNL